MTPNATIHAEELYQRMANGEPCVIVDVRSIEEYRSLHAAGALPLALDDCTPENLERCLSEHGLAADTPLYLICHSGQRAAQAAETLRERFPRCMVIAGGTLAWAQAGLPVRPGEQP